MDASLTKAVEQWLSWNKDEASSNEIKRLVDKKEYSQLEKLLCSRMEFGTAGLRAKMGAGFSQMNTLTIIQTAQGLLKHAQSQFTPEELASKGIVIAFDARYNSKSYASLTASIFARAGCRVRLFSDICPTPYVAFSCRFYGLCLGVMCTASHNPKQDNGYKVYWSNGAQIIPPHDKAIADAIVNNLEPWESSWEIPSIPEIYINELINDPMAEVDVEYMKLLKTSSTRLEKNRKSKLKFTYTPVHGVGTKFVKLAMKTFNLPELIEVPLQCKPDPEFPTAEFPNPEEGKGVLKLAMEAAEAGGSRHVLASDPDADRLAVVEKQDDGSWRAFTGNELGAIFGWWAVSNWKNSGSPDGENTYMLASTVSSVILKTIAKKENLLFEDTLTGFKWMGSRAKELIDQGKKVIFAFEEAIGFMYGQNVLDKDGVSAAAVMAEIITTLHEDNISLSQQLDNIYNTYGYHVTNNSYYICHDKEVINTMFARIRNWGKNSGVYPEALGRFKISGIRDLYTGFDTREEDKIAKLPVSKTSHMITFYFDGGAVLTMRTSGTEPKIKFYSEMIGSSRESCTSELNELIELMVKDFYQPEKNGLIARSLS